MKRPFVIRTEFEYFSSSTESSLVSSNERSFGIKGLRSDALFKRKARVTGFFAYRLMERISLRCSVNLSVIKVGSCVLPITGAEISDISRERSSARRCAERRSWMRNSVGADRLKKERSGLP